MCSRVSLSSAASITSLRQKAIVPVSEVDIVPRNPLFVSDMHSRVVCALAPFALLASSALAQPRKQQARPTPAAGAQPQKVDEEYTRLIKEYTQDPRISTELVDHMPASDIVPS